MSFPHISLPLSHNIFSMKNRLIVVGLLILFACKSREDEFHEPENALDAGREFIQLSLQGKFNSASRYMLADNDNIFWLDKWSKDFSKISEQEKASFAKSSINIAEVDDAVPDSVTVIVFSNSFKKTPQKIKVVKYNGHWKVDFKYTFSENP